jgi:hypothetical protein
MKRYLVFTPSYGTVIPVTDEGEGPLEFQADVVEIDAENARDAVAFGVREMLRLYPDCYCGTQRQDGRSPYTGVRAELIGDR